MGFEPFFSIISINDTFMDIYQKCNAFFISVCFILFCTSFVNTSFVYWARIYCKQVLIIFNIFLSKMMHWLIHTPLPNRNYLQSIAVTK